MRVFFFATFTFTGITGEVRCPQQGGGLVSGALFPQIRRATLCWPRALIPLMCAICRNVFSLPQWRSIEQPRWYSIFKPKERKGCLHSCAHVCLCATTCTRGGTIQLQHILRCMGGTHVRVRLQSFCVQGNPHPDFLATHLRAKRPTRVTLPSS